MNRSYYSTRTMRNPLSLPYDLPTIKSLFRVIYERFDEKHYFQGAFGYFCVDGGQTPGSLGMNIEGHIFLRIHKVGLWPILEKVDNYSEDDLFDVIEFLFDNISKPIAGYYHDFSDCGYHGREFESAPAKEEFQSEINEILGSYKEGYELTSAGEIVFAGDLGMGTLVKEDLPDFTPGNVRDKVARGIAKFHQRRATTDDMRDSVRELADALEYLKPVLQQKKIFTKDESDLFNIINNYGIRHHNQKQKTDYDPAYLWWMFYTLLAKIHFVLRRLSAEDFPKL